MVPWTENIDLRPYNSFGVQVFARYFQEFSSITQLMEMDIPVNANRLVIGGGSNILFRQNFDGYVCHNQMKGINKIAEDNDFVYLKVGGGEQWHHFVEVLVFHHRRRATCPLLGSYSRPIETVEAQPHGLREPTSLGGLHPRQRNHD
jgi:UDP-N-acetylmuramate dehydrogenase